MVNYYDDDDMKIGKVILNNSGVSTFI